VGDSTTSAAISFTWTVSSPISVTRPNDQTSTEGDSPTLTLGASGGGTKKYSAVGLPLGLQINTSSGVISGTVGAGASVYGPYWVTVTASDGTSSDRQSFHWTVKNPITITIPEVPTAREGEAYSLQIDAEDSTSGTLTYTAMGLPGDFTIDSVSGVISGTPGSAVTSAGLFTVSVIVSNGSYSNTRSFLITVLMPSRGLHNKADEKSPRQQVPPQQDAWRPAIDEEMVKFLKVSEQYAAYVKDLMAGMPKWELYLKYTGQEKAIEESKDKVLILKPIGTAYMRGKIPAPPGQLEKVEPAKEPPRTKAVILLTGEFVPWNGSLGLAPLELMNPEKFKKDALDFIVVDARGKDTLLYDLGQKAMGELGVELKKLQDAGTLEAMKSDELIKLLEKSAVKAVKEVGKPYLQEGKTLIWNVLVDVLRKHNMAPKKDPVTNAIQARRDQVRVFSAAGEPLTPERTTSSGFQISPSLKLSDITNLGKPGALKDNISIFGGRLIYNYKIDGKEGSVEFTPFFKYEWRKDDPRHHYMEGGFHVIIAW
jgi:hypothetical protein